MRGKDNEYGRMIELNEGLGDEFFDDQTNSLNPIRAWFHRSSNSAVDRLVRKYTAKGAKIVDLGCGTCNWNRRGMPVTGIDINEKMPKYAKRIGRLKDYRVEDINRTGLKSNSVDVIITTETLEHIPNYTDTIAEIRRVLKPGGIAIVTVPYDTNLSLWKPLFAVQCFIQGYLLDKELYRRNCGHINHFSPKRLSKDFEKRGFSIAEQINGNFFYIIIVARKN
ncbi:MAG: class I SAM-dependent methyltransferase [Candidatus Woesearchaeota archaeon]